MFLWPDGYNRQPQNPLKQLIEKTKGDILLLLEEELFIKQAKLGDTLAVETLVQGTLGLLEVMFMDYKYVLSEHFEQLTNQYSIMWELIDLKLDKVNTQLLYHWELVFQLLNNELTVEIQWYFALRIISFISQEKPSLLDNHQDKLIKLYDHLEYTYVAQIITEMMINPLNYYQKSFIAKGIQEFDQLTELQAINFTYVIHELFTKTKKQDFIEFIITSSILNKMFEVIQSTNIIVAKNAAHIISIVSNYYSNELQNLDLEEEESEQITVQFHSSIFYKIIKNNLHIFYNLIKVHCDKNLKVTQLIIKLIEIVDNLVRITNISLWEFIHQEQIMVQIIRLCNIYKKSDILSSQVERMVFYIFERALNDYHPFWAFQFIKVYQIQNNINSMFSRQVYAFVEKLDTKIANELDFITYDIQILEIKSEIQQSTIWGKTQWKLKLQQCENQKKLGSQMKITEEDTKLIETNEILKVTLTNQEEIEENEEKKGEIEVKGEEDKNSNQNKEEQKLNQDEKSDILQQEIQISDNELDSESSSSSESKGELEQNKFKSRNQNPLMSFSANLEQLAFQSRKNKLNLEQIEKIRKKSIQFEMISQHMSQAGRRLSLQAGLNIKELSPTYLEFKCDLEKRVLRNINDNSILKVDELDQSINQ